MRKKDQLPERKSFIRNDRAVSEIMGAVLLIGIVVIMLSVEGAFVFSRGGPEDIPHASLQEWMDTSDDTIYIKHCTGETIWIDELEIVANVNGERYAYTSPEISEGLGNKIHWNIGEVLAIDARSAWGLDLKDYDEIDLYIVDTPTKELIQKVELTTDFREEPYLSGWITPHGYAIDKSNGSAELHHVQFEERSEDDPNTYTLYNSPKKDKDGKTNPNIYQEFYFGINPCLYGFRPGDSFSNVTLRIVYQSYDNSGLTTELRFYDIDNPTEWVSKTLTLPDKNTFGDETFNLTEYINNTEDLANFKVRLQAVSNANGKKVSIDYLALWVE